jgi:hypothetical protein
MTTSKKNLSRREFARRASLGTAALSASLLAPPEAGPFATGREISQLPNDAEKLSAESQAEAETRYQAILAKYSGRFTDVQTADLKRLCFVLQPQLDSLRAWSISNSDQPALYFKPLVEREKKTNAAPNLKSAPQTAEPEVPAKPSTDGKN